MTDQQDTTHRDPKGSTELNDLAEARAIILAQERFEAEGIAARDALERERARLDEAQAIAKTGSWVLDFATQSMTWSGECHRINEIPREGNDVPYTVFLDRVHPEDRDLAATAFTEAVALHVPYTIEHRLLLPDGSVKWVHQRCEIAYDAEGNPLRAVGTTQDITERKNVDLELRRSQQALRMASRLGQIGAWSLDLADAHFHWSDEVCAIHGLPSGHRPQLDDALSFYSPVHRDAIRSALAACLTAGTAFDLEAQIVTAAGERAWIRIIGEAERNDSGAVRGARGAVQNITDSKRSDEALLSSDERFRLVARAVSDVIWDWDITTDVCWWSEGLETQFGYPERTRPSADFWVDGIHPEDRRRVVDSLNAAIESGEVWVESYRFRRADGTYAQLSDRALVARDGQGRAYRVVGAMVDISQQHELETQLDQARRVATLGRLAGKMAHEFNNVLMGIQPFVEVIRRLTPDLPRAQDAASRIVQSVKRGKEITDGILRFTRTVEPVVQPLPVSAWLLEFSAEALTLAGDVCTIEIELPAEELVIDGDAAQLNQALANLVKNARDASVPGSRIVLSAGSLGSQGDSTGLTQLELIVRDSGLGIDADVLPHVFEPLFTTKKAGTGLGLAVTQQIVMKHGGHVTAESEPGGGTTIRIVLPARRAGGAPDEPRRSRGRKLPELVLLVEDEQAVAEGVVMLLTTEGVRTRTVFEGKRAMDAIARYVPDLVLLDVALPDMSGIDLFALIHERWPQLPVVIMTGHYSRDDLTSVLATPHVGFLQKPFGIDQLLDVISECASTSGAVERE